MTIRKFDQIDGLRFFAVFAVVCAHWKSSLTDLAQLITSASRGVDLFFVISGFLITLGLIRSKERSEGTGTSLYKFYIRRFLRIFPIYYLTVFILLIFHYNEIWSSLWWYLLYLINFHIIKTQTWGVAGHFWSLSVEEQFYMVWPFIILFVSDKKLPVVIMFSVLLSVAIKIYWHFNNFSFWYGYMHPLGALDALAIGALLAYFFYFHQEKLRRVLYQPLVITIVIAQMILMLWIQYSPQWRYIHEIGIRTSFALFAMWLTGRAAFGYSGMMGYLLNSRVLRYIGKISYSIYLFHIFVPGMLLGLKYPENENLRFLMNAMVTIGLSSLSWYLFESRILKLKERFE